MTVQQQNTGIKHSQVADGLLPRINGEAPSVSQSSIKIKRQYIDELNFVKLPVPGVYHQIKLIGNNRRRHFKY